MCARAPDYQNPVLTVELLYLPTHNSLNNSSNSPHLIEPGSSLPCSEWPTNWPYLDQSESNTRLHIVFNFNFNITPPNKTTQLSTQFCTSKMSQLSHCKGCRYWNIYYVIWQSNSWGTWTYCNGVTVSLVSKISISSVPVPRIVLEDWEGASQLFSSNHRSF